MKFYKIILFIIAFPLIVAAQTNVKSKTVAAVNPAKFTPAYAELLLRKTERESALEEFLVAYTDEFPKVKELKFELTVINKEMERVLAMPDTGRLTLALGKLMVRKTELATDLWNIQQHYSDDHPEVKRAKRKLEVYEKAIKEIVP